MTSSKQQSLSKGLRRSVQKFLKFFPRGFQDQKYFDWERHYKEEAHQRWQEVLNRAAFQKLLKENKFHDIANLAIGIESRTNLLFSFEKMAIRDAVKSDAGARAFAVGLYDLLYGSGTLSKRFEKWCEVVEKLPRKQTRVLTWPIATVFGFLAQPRVHIFLKPVVTKNAAEQYGREIQYQPRPDWRIYSGILKFAADVKRDLKKMKPRDMIDVQSFLWVLGSQEYA
jgi:hypothetical protein